MKIFAVMMCLFLLSGCAALKETWKSGFGEKSRGYVSYVVADLSEIDSTELSKDVSQFLMNQLPAAKTTLELEPLKSPFHEKLRDQLSRKSFGIIEKNFREPWQGVQVRYLITRYEGGLLVRVQYLGKTATRFYDRTQDGRLATSASYTLREATK